MSELNGKTLVNYAINIMGNNDLFKSWDFVFMSAWIGQQMPNGNIAIADGRTDFLDKVIYLKVHECYWHSAIFHEMGHVILLHKLGNKGFGHKHKIWEKIKSIEDTVIKDLCSSDYDIEKAAPKGVQRL
ncbi:MAG: hypothetical protein ACXAC5_05125 [Promethearchaeota archaeon]|jgi:hypothetical protein